MYVGPISVRDGLLDEVKAAVRLINSLPETHPVRQRLSRKGRSYVAMNSFASAALEWLLETLANQEPLLRPEERNTQLHSTEPEQEEEGQ